jgi:hypothetical protein
MIQEVPMYLAGKIHKELKTHFAPEELIGCEIPYGEISKRLNRILRPMGAKIRVKRDPELKTKKTSIKQNYTFSGYYETERKKNAIVLSVHLNPSKRTFKFTKQNYNGMIFMFSQIAQHEFIHESQFYFRPDQAERKVRVYHSDKISKKRLEQIEYLREWCEIEAYAHDIAMEINYYYGNMNPSTVIKHIDKHTKLYSYMFYKRAFKGTDWNRLKKSLLRKIWRWIPSAQVPLPV